MPKTRLFRLTWNTNRWEFPIGHVWKKENQGNRDIAWENQYGYGGEEWLFNPRFKADEYQYGYIRGAADIAPDTDIIDTVYLFTLNKATRERFLVGEIKALEIIHRDTTLSTYGENIFQPYRLDMIRELREVGADASNFLSLGINQLSKEVMKNVDEEIHYPRGFEGQEKYCSFC